MKETFTSPQQIDLVLVNPGARPMMVTGTVCPALNKRRPTAAAGVINCLPGNSVDLNNIIAVNPVARDREARKTAIDIITGLSLAEMGKDRVEIILTHIDNGQCFEHGKIDAFIDNALFYRGIPKKGD